MKIAKPQIQFVEKLNELVKDEIGSAKIVPFPKNSPIPSGYDFEGSQEDISKCQAAVGRALKSNKIGL